jgi:hypothetical protein
MCVLCKVKKARVERGVLKGEGHGARDGTPGIASQHQNRRENRLPPRKPTLQIAKKWKIKRAVTFIITAISSTCNSFPWPWRARPESAAEQQKDRKPALRIEPRNCKNNHPPTIPFFTERSETNLTRVSLSFPSPPPVRTTPASQGEMTGLLTRTYINEEHSVLVSDRGFCMVVRVEMAATLHGNELEQGHSSSQHGVARESKSSEGSIAALARTCIGGSKGATSLWCIQSLDVDSQYHDPHHLGVQSHHFGGSLSSTTATTSFP